MCFEYLEFLFFMLEEYCYILMVVMDWGEVKVDFIDMVIDNVFVGGYMVGCYLVECGYWDIGVIFGLLECNIGVGWLVGFMKVMEEVLINVLDNWIVQGDFELEFGYYVMQ